jgi:glutathione S-transferase
MLTVHHLRYSRSTRILWLLEEIGQPYELVCYDRDPKTWRSPPDLKTIHPLGKAPVIEDDGLVIAESGAIIDYLIARYAGGKLGPAPGDRLWPAVNEWLHYGESGGMFGLIATMVGGRQGLPPRGKAFAMEEIDHTFTMMAAALEGSGFLVGDTLSGADIQMQYVVETARSMGLLGDRPAISAYNERMTARPAHRRAIEKGGPIPLPVFGG